MALIYTGNDLLSHTLSRAVQSALRFTVGMMMMEFGKAVSSPEEFLVCTDLLPAIRRRYSTTFSLVEIPEVLHSDQETGEHGSVFFRYYDGETYNHRWSEQPGDHTGGCSLGTELSAEMAQLLKELQQIDVCWLLSLESVGKALGRSAFDLRGWLLSLHSQRAAAIGMGVSDAELGQASELVNDGFHLTRRIFNNGDFYPRNLIKFKGKFLLIDWGYWSGYRVCFVDDLVNVAAFAFIHMWNNIPWQKEFFRHLTEIFGITPDDFRKGCAN